MFGSVAAPASTTHFNQTFIAEGDSEVFVISFKRFFLLQKFRAQTASSAFFSFALFIGSVQYFV